VTSVKYSLKIHALVCLTKNNNLLCQYTLKILEKSMKRTILFTFLCLTLLTTMGLAQHVSSSDSSNEPIAEVDTSNPDFQKAKIKVYPNPASDYIKLNTKSNVDKIKVLNMVGKIIKHFNVIQTGEKYNISAIPNGLYLVQLLDSDGKVITTKRLNKR